MGELIGRRLGHYRIVEQIGAGGMGVVYRAHDERLDRDVAIKLLPAEVAADPERLNRFEREAKSVARLDHPNILAIHHLGTHEGSPFIVTELLEGQSLREIATSGALNPRKAFEYGMQVATGLAAAHDKGVTHRDLKPENLFLTRHGLIKILDFGLAKLAREGLEGTPETEGTTLTADTTPGKLMGTVGYMAPEQTRGQAADHRTDIFALGVVLYELIAGERPFRGDTAVDTAAAILKDDPPPLHTVMPGTPKAAEAVILRCLEKRPEDRFQSARDLGFALQSVAEGGDAAELELELAKAPELPPFLEAAVEEVERPVFVGREAELTSLDGFLEGAVSGKGSVAFVTGDAGTGKTALVGEFVRRVIDAHEDLVVAAGGCSAQAGEGDPYAPFRQVLALLTGDVGARVESGTLSREQGTRLWHMASVVAEAIVESGPDLVDTLIPGGGLLARAEVAAGEGAPWLQPLRELVERKASLPPDAGLQQSALFMQCARLVQTVAAKQPLLIVLEDLHWSDAGSIALLFHIGREVQGSRVLIVGTYRPAEVALGRGGERHPLEPVVAEIKGIYGEVMVELGQVADHAFVDALLDSEPNRLGREFRETVFDQTQGHALFTVELLRTMRDRGMLVQDDDGQWCEGHDLDWQALPAKVEGVISARIERLSENLRDILTVASVEGEAFTAEVVARVRDVDTRETIRQLSRELQKRHRLVSARGIRTLETGRLSLFGFSHVLFQRFLYNNLNEVERAQLHEDVGTVLESLYGDQTEEISPQLARHFDEAGIIDRAIHYHHQASERAKRMLANLEAIGHLERALELLANLPESSDRDHQELGLQVGLYAPLFVAHGPADAYTGRVAERCYDLCSRIGDDPQLIPILAMVADFYTNGAKVQQGIEVAQRMLELAQHVGDQVQEMVARRYLGYMLAVAGRLMEGREHLEMATACYDPETHHHLAAVYGLNPGVTSYAHLTWINALLGNLDLAVQIGEQAVALAEQVDHPASKVLPHFFAAMSRCFRHEIERARHHADVLNELARKHDVGILALFGELLRGQLLVFDGDADGATAHFDAIFSAMKSAGGCGGDTIFVAAIAEAQHAAGRHDVAIAAVDMALGEAEIRPERCWESEFHHLKGQILLETHGPEEAEACFLQAIEAARSMNARFWELRAATSLARLWQSQGKRREAHELLAPVYEWFTEGLNTAPLQDAKALLKELEQELSRVP